MKEDVMYISAIDFFSFIKINGLVYNESTKEVIIDPEKELVGPEVHFFKNLGSIEEGDVKLYVFTVKFEVFLPEVYYKVVVRWKDKSTTSVNSSYDFSYIKVIGMSLITSETDLSNVVFDAV